MTRRVFVALTLMLTAAAAAMQAQKGGVPADLVGVWAGSWEGAGSSGGFELTLDKGKDGPDAGRVSVTGDMPYQATFSTLKFDGKKMMAAYDFPPDSQVEVALEITFEATSAKGSWSARTKANGAEVAAGTVELKQKK